MPEKVKFNYNLTSIFPSGNLSTLLLHVLYNKATLYFNLKKVKGKQKSSEVLIRFEKLEWCHDNWTKLTDAITESDDSTNLFPNGKVSVVESAAIECGDLHGRCSEPSSSLPIIDCIATSLRRSLGTTHRKLRRVETRVLLLLPGLKFTYLGAVSKCCRKRWNWTWRGRSESQRQLHQTTTRAGSEGGKRSKSLRFGVVHWLPQSLEHAITYDSIPLYCYSNVRVCVSVGVAMSRVRKREVDLEMEWSTWTGLMRISQRPTKHCHVEITLATDQLREVLWFFMVFELR